MKSNELSVEESVRPSNRKVNITDTTDDHPVCRSIHCNVSGFYLIKGVDDNVGGNMYLLAGNDYPLMTVNIQAENGGAPTPDSITLLY